MIQRVEAGRELGAQHLAELGKSLPDLMAQGVTTIYLDTSRVVEFDSQTLEAILEFDALANSRSLAVWVISPSETLALALDVTGLWDRLRIGQPEDGEHGVDEVLETSEGESR
jgi:hypothetical protein